MDFLIKQHATIPVLTMKMVENNDIDINSLNIMMKNAAVTFSMIDVETGKYAIANKSGGILNIDEGINITTSGDYDGSTYIIYYDFTERDTRNSGQFKGEFTINFFDDDNNSKGKLIVPIQDELNIHIMETYGKTSINGV
jgi:hypothetical protein